MAKVNIVLSSIIVSIDWWVVIGSSLLILIHLRQLSKIARSKNGRIVYQRRFGGRIRSTK